MVVDYPEALSMRYKLNSDTLSLTSDELLEHIGKKRGCILSGGVINKQKSAEIIIQDFRDGRIGRVSLETPAWWEQWMMDATPEDMIE
jgi:ribosome biogenesis GTPase A